MFKIIAKNIAYGVITLVAVLYPAHKFYFMDDSADLEAQRKALAELTRKNDDLEKLKPQLAALQAQTKDVELKNADISRRVPSEAHLTVLFDEMQKQGPYNGLNFDSIELHHPDYKPGELNKSPFMIVFSSPLGDPNLDPRFRVAANQVKFMKWFAGYDQLMCVNKLTASADPGIQRAFLKIEGFVPVDAVEKSQPKNKLVGK